MSAHNDSWIGRTLGGRYKILNIIEKGGMGVVYRAQQLTIDREVAIKMLRSDVAGDANWVERFRREAKACSALAHPNTIRLYDYGQTSRGDTYMVMELLKGRSLHDMINSEAPISPARVLRIMMQCCASLSEAHSVGIVHRDIKPENIYIQKLAGTHDFVKLFDFSIAKYSDFKLTAAGTILGTPEYMSPEQADGGAIDHRSDIYSLGVVAYIMLKGGPLFQGGAPLEVLRRHMTEIPPPLPNFVPTSVAKLVLSCLEKNPDDRPKSALALLEAAQVWLSEIDPRADLASDPSLHNTLSGMPYKTGTKQMPASLASKSVMRTMLGTVGAATVFAEEASVAQPAAQSQAGPKKPRTLLHAGGGPSASFSPISVRSGAAPLPGVAKIATQTPPIAQTPHSIPPASPSPAPAIAIAIAQNGLDVSDDELTHRGRSPLFWVTTALIAFGLGFAAFYLVTVVG